MPWKIEENEYKETYFSISLKVCPGEEAATGVYIWSLGRKNAHLDENIKILSKNCIFEIPAKPWFRIPYFDYLIAEKVWSLVLWILWKET